VPGPRAFHVLLCAFLKGGDNSGALGVAGRATEAGVSRVGLRPKLQRCSHTGDARVGGIRLHAASSRDGKQMDKHETAAMAPAWLLRVVLGSLRPCLC
jgi:hypothetical protein